MESKRVFCGSIGVHFWFVCCNLFGNSTMKYNDRCGERLDTELRFIMDTFPKISIASKNRPKPKRKGSSPNPHFWGAMLVSGSVINLQGGSLPLFTCHCFFFFRDMGWKVTSWNHFEVPHRSSTILSVWFGGNKKNFVMSIARLKRDLITII